MMSDAAQTQAHLEAQRQIFKAEAKAIAQKDWTTPQVGVADYIKESQTIAAFARSVWEAGPEGAPGLKVARQKFSLDHLARLHGLLAALQHAEAQVLTMTTPTPDIGPKVKRARFLISELDASLSFILDDDVEEPADDKLDALQETTQDAKSSGATIGQLLLAWTLFAQEERDKLSTLEDFNLALIDEAATLSRALSVAEPTDATDLASVRAERAGLCTLIHRALLRLRQAAGYAFRRHPDVKQRFFSALERNLRAQRRLQKKLAEVNSAPPSADAPTT
jgi:hypothetical protein